MKRLTLLALGLLLLAGPSLRADEPKDKPKENNADYLPTLAKGLESSDFKTRWGTAVTLRNLGEKAKNAIPALEAALKKETNPDVKEMMQRALDDIQSAVKKESPEVKLLLSFKSREGVLVRPDRHREGNPTAVSVTASDFSDLDVAPILLVENLEHLSLSGTSVGDEGLKQLEKKTMLRSLDLSKTRVTDKGMAALKGMTSLTYLNLAETAITDQGLEALKGLTQLRTLDLSKDLIRGPGLEALKGMKSLASLNLTDTRVEDIGLEQIKNLTSLVDLYLAGTNVDNAALANLSGLSHLEKLDLARTKIADTGLERLKTLTNLREIKVGGTRVTTSGIQELQQALPARTFIVFP